MIVLLAPNAVRDEPPCASAFDTPLDTVMHIAEIGRATSRYRSALPRITRRPDPVDDNGDDAVTWEDAEWQ